MSPLGTLATVIPIAKIKLVMAGYPMINPAIKNVPPHITENIANREINLLISWDNGEGYGFAAIANPAIWPIKVLSPVNITTPFPVPYLFKVEKKAIFLDSKGLFRLVHSGTLARSSVYPVREELSTFIPWDDRILISAGIFFPSSILTTSPRTNLDDYKGF
jgi:hypothetical protein